MALGVHHVLGDPLPIEVGHLLDQVVILEEQWTFGSNGEGELIARCSDPRVSGRSRDYVVIGHDVGTNTYLSMELH
jgi:hypothetical protein